MNTYIVKFVNEDNEFITAHTMANNKINAMQNIRLSYQCKIIIDAYPHPYR